MRDGSKAAIILALIRRPEGATIHETRMGRSGRHTASGDLSPVHWAKKMGLKIETTKEADGWRAYRVGIVS